MSDSAPISAEDCLKICLEACEDRKAADLEAYDLRGQSVIADYIVICSGNSMPHLRAIYNGVSRTMKDNHIAPKGIEGKPESGWILLDFADVLVHVFHPDSRDFYRIEELVEADRKIYPTDEEE